VDQSSKDMLLLYINQILHHKNHLYDWKKKQLLKTKKRNFNLRNNKYKLLIAIHSFGSTPSGCRINSPILHWAIERVNTANSLSK